MDTHSGMPVFLVCSMPRYSTLDHLQGTDQCSIWNFSGFGGSALWRDIDMALR